MYRILAHFCVIGIKAGNSSEIPAFLYVLYCLNLYKNTSIRAVFSIECYLCSLYANFGEII